MVANRALGGQTHRVPPPLLCVYSEGVSLCKTHQYAGVPPVFYRVNPWKSGCYNTVKPVDYMPYYRDLDSHTFGCHFFCYRKIDTSPILRIVECIKEMVTTYIIKGLPSPREVFQKKNYKKNAK